MTNTTTTDYLSVTLTAMNILDRVNNLRNTSVTDSLANEIATLIRTLVNDCNAKYLKDLPIDVICKSTTTSETELKSWYFPDLNLVLSRTDHYLELYEKKLDELHSSNSIKTSILVNGDDFYG